MLYRISGTALKAVSRDEPPVSEAHNHALLLPACLFFAAFIHYTQRFGGFPIKTDFTDTLQGMLSFMVHTRMTIELIR